MITTIQVLLFTFMAGLGTIGAFCLLCFVVIQFAEPIGWIPFAKLVGTTGGAVVLYWLWWKFDVLGCTTAVERVLRRQAERQKTWAKSSPLYQAIVVILTICMLLQIAIQSHKLREELKGPRPMSGGVITAPRSTVVPTPDTSPMIKIADEHMRANQPGEALAAYQAAWSKLRGELTQTQQVWLLLSIANAAVRLGDFDEAINVLSVLPEHYGESGIVVGNPLFHLLVGLTFHGLKENPDGETDNFARALICGGPAIFSGEDPSHLRRIEKILDPPAELETWKAYEGCSRDTLNQATGYLRDLLTEKIGSEPPYH